MANEKIARRSDVAPDAVRRWRNRFAQEAVIGVVVVAKGRVIQVD